MKLNLNFQAQFPARSKITCGLLLAALLIPLAASAGTNGMRAPFFRGQTNTLFTGWDNFAWPFETNNPASIAGSTGGAALSQSDTNAFLTGTLNIYNLAGTSRFAIVESLPFMAGTVILQVRMLGAELDYNSVLLQYVTTNGTQSLATPRLETLRDPVGLGTVVASWEWNVGALGLTNYTVLFSAAGTSLSLDAVMLDTRAFIPQVEKLADLKFLNDEDAYYPLDRFSQHGTNLWFTTERGGSAGDVGSISRFDLVTRQVVTVAGLGNATGFNPEGGILIVGDEGFFTTKNGGDGDRGTIAKIDLISGAVTPMFSFPTNGNNFLGATPRGTPALIGNDLFVTTSSGGSNGMGTIVRFSLVSNAVVQAHHFDGAATGRQPYDGFAQVGGDYYFTAFAGGTNTGTGFGNGAGTLSKMSFDSSSNMVVTKVADMPGGYTQLPASLPVAVGTNTLYFTTVGPNASPGSIVRYTIDSGTATIVFRFTNDAQAQVLYGKQIYSSLTRWQDDLYFTSRQGGLSNLGVIAKFNMTSNTVTKIADLIGAGANSLGSGSGGFNSGLVVEENGQAYMYFPTSRGGVNFGTGVTAGAGTVVRVALPAAAVQLSLARIATNEYTLSWTGGYPPFSVQARTNFSGGAWGLVTEGLTNRSITFTNAAVHRFHRVSGQ